MAGSAIFIAEENTRIVYDAASSGKRTYYNLFGFNCPAEVGTDHTAIIAAKKRLGYWALHDLLIGLDCRPIFPQRYRRQQASLQRNSWAE